MTVISHGSNSNNNSANQNASGNDGVSTTGGYDRNPSPVVDQRDESENTGDTSGSQENSTDTGLGMNGDQCEGEFPPC